MGTHGAITGVLGLLLLAGPGEAAARQLAEKSFGGSGWNQAATTESIALPASFGAVSRGAFSFDLQRTGDIPVSRPETIFELVDARGERTLRVKIGWTAPDPGGAALFFQGGGGGDAFFRHGLGLWGPVVELDRPVAVGQKIHVDLTWDDGPGSYLVFVDGRGQSAWRGGFDPVQKTWYQDRRTLANAAADKSGQARPYDSRPLGSFLSDVTAVHLGNADSPRRSPGRSRSLLLHALVENFSVFADEIPASGATPVIAAVDHDAVQASGFSGKLVAGDTLHVTVHGTPGCRASFDVAHFPDIGGTIALDWRGWGVATETGNTPGAGDVDLRDVEGYRVYASAAPFDPAAPGIEPTAELAVGVQRYTFGGLEVDRPYYLAAVARMRDGTTRTIVAPIAHQPLTETAAGTYDGSYRALWQDGYPRAVVVGRLESAGAVAALTNAIPLAIDPGLAIAVATDPPELEADGNAKAKVVVSVTDANGRPVPGHKVKFLLATTSLYTGVVGGGEVNDQAGGTITADRWLETDLFGRAQVTYVAGFAAKTAIIVARDLQSNSTGAGWVTTRIRATAQLRLEPVGETAAGGYALAVTSSDDWLTADGQSQARITARVTLGGQPVEGHRVSFSSPSGNGSVRAVKDTTNRNGEARAVYTAGKKAGIVLITATDTTAGISETVSIRLRSDAPAKIAVTLEPDALPADGRSRADLSVLVTDVNDNPNDNTGVEFQISSGGGSLGDTRGVTDRKGECGTVYTAGRSAGTVTFEITVRSPAPTAAELAKAADLAVTVVDHTFF
jgi:hypothetical protein